MKTHKYFVFCFWLFQYFKSVSLSFWILSCTCRLACFLECVAELSLWEDKGPKLCMLPLRYDLHLLPVSQYEPIWYHCSPLKDSFLNAVVLVCLIFSSLTLLQSQSFVSKGRLQAFVFGWIPPFTFAFCLMLPDPFLLLFQLSFFPLWL